MGVARLFGLCVALLFASSVGAATTIDLGPSDYRNWGTGSNSHTGAGIRSSTGQTVRLPPLNGNLNVTRNAVIPYGSLANGMRNFVRINPASAAASAAVTGLFLAVDWYFDQEIGEWAKQDFIPDPDPQGSYWYVNQYPERTFRTPSEACNFYGTTLPPVYSVNSTSFVIHSDYSGYCYADVDVGENNLPSFALGPITRSGDCSEGTVYIPEQGACFLIGPVSLSNSDFSDLAGYLPSASPDQVGAAGHDTQRMIGNPLPGFQDQTITGPSSVSGPETTSTSVDPVTGDTIVTTTNTTTNINYSDTTITTTNTTTTTTYQNGQETGSTVTTETPGELPVTDTGGGGVSGEWPGFCDWATVLCDWLAWTREDPPPEQDLPAVIDDDFFEEKRISFGSKSCPPDHEINLAPFLGTTVGVSFQPLCDFAGLIYYMVMAASYIIAAYISIGVARNA